MIARFKKSKYEPKPIETDYWIDLQENEYGGVFKFYDYNTKVWKQIQSVTTEKEPQFTNSAAFNISDTDIASWNSKLEGSDLDAFKQEVYYMITTSGGVSQETFDFELGLVRKELETKAVQANTLAGYGITNAYTKTQIDDKLKNLEIELPTNVSYFVNDAKYVTEDTLSSKLPEDIVSDSNYVHTDNNFTNTLKQKLEGINLTPINNSISDIDSRVKTNESDILTVKQSNSNLQYSLGELTDEVNNKPNLEDVYTRTYLDNIFTTFVRKTHNTYGFLDERPTDLEVTDTGFIFYDYSVNEPLIWVADRWRTLLSNEPIGWYLLDRDLTTSIGNWEFTEIGADTCLLTKYVPSLDLNNDISQDDVFVPNTYSGMFTLEVGDNQEQNQQYETLVIEDTVNFTYYTPDKSSSVKYVMTVYTPEQYTNKYIQTTIPEDVETVEYSNVFNKECIQLYKGTTHNTYKVVENSQQAAVNSVSLSKGIKKINNSSFANLALTDTQLNVPSGVNTIGECAFMNCGLTSVSFPNNPYKIKHYAFAYNKINEVTFPSTLDYDYILDGGGWGMFAQNTSETGMTVNIPNGTKAIPTSAFHGTKITNPLSIPNSLVYLGSNAFYDSQISGAFDSNNLEKIGSFSFRNNKLSSITIRDNLKFIGPYAFYPYGSDSSAVNSLTLGQGIEYIGYGSFYYFSNCYNNIILPPKVKEVGSYAFGRYNIQLRNFNNFGLGYTSWSKNINTVIREYVQQDTCTLHLNEGLKYIGTAAFINTCFNGELVLPESLVAIGDYAFDWSSMFNNVTLRIPKNLRYIGGLPVRRDWRVLYRPELLPSSPNGWTSDNIAKYIEDGGKMENKATFAFYLLAGLTLKSFEVDPENQWFKSVDGLLLSKDGTRLVAVPTQYSAETIVIPEGVTCIDTCCICRNGMKAQYKHKQSDGTFVDMFVQGYSANFSDDDLLCLNTQEVPMKYLQLPNSYKVRTPRELIRDFPCTCVPDANELVAVTYFSRVDKYIVKDDNPYYKNDGDWLLSKDGTELVALANGQKGDIYIPDSVTTILPGFTPMARYKDYNGNIQQLVDIDEMIEATTPCGATSDAWACQYKGIYLHIGPNVVNVSDYVLRELSSMNLTYGMGVYIDENNPAITINGKGWVVRKETE